MTCEGSQSSFRAWREDVRCLVIPHICLTFETKPIYKTNFILYIRYRLFHFEKYNVPNQTTSKRIPISLKPELYAVISDLAEIQNKPMSKVVVELLEEMQPILESMASAMVEVKKSNDPTAVLKQFGQNAIMDANELLGGFSQEIKKL